MGTDGNDPHSAGRGERGGVGRCLAHCMEATAREERKVEPEEPHFGKADPGSEEPPQETMMDCRLKVIWDGGGPLRRLAILGGWSLQQFSGQLAISSKCGAWAALRAGVRCFQRSSALPGWNGIQPWRIFFGSGPICGPHPSAGTLGRNVMR